MSTELDEREFLLRSIRDLDAEFEAGDIDEADYHSLRDEYTARAAAVLRGEADPVVVADDAFEGPDAPGRRRSRTLMAVGGSLVVAGLAAFLIATNVGQRGAGQTITGNAQTGQSGLATTPGSAGDPRLAQAEADFSKGDAVNALKLLDGVLKDNPRNPEALAYEGWMIRLAGLTDQGLAKELAAEQADPGYPDAHFFRGVILFEDKADAPDAVKELRLFISLDPTSPGVPRAEQTLQAALKADPSVATTVDPRTNPSIASNFGPTTTAGPSAP
ncbi:MAG TPA: hypothetical protein VKV34_09585 [Thermoleophilia bacterium]|nr:hypothetical protein [Thermoleophilia bacterium]